MFRETQTQMNRVYELRNRYSNAVGEANIIQQHVDSI